MNEMKEENGRRISFGPSLLDVIVCHASELNLDKVLKTWKLTIQREQGFDARFVIEEMGVK